MFEDATPEGLYGSQVRRILEWAEHSGTGDRAELDFEPHPRVWAALSVRRAASVPGRFAAPQAFRASPRMREHWPPRLTSWW